jgi:predicted transposase/invertase (TIGR01784 family)
LFSIFQSETLSEVALKEVKKIMSKKKNNSLNNPHDLLVKATLSNPKAIQEFAKAHFPADALKRIDLPSLRLTNKSYVTEELKEFHNDLVFSFTIDNQPGYAFCLLEHQSSPDFLMALRFIKYNLALLEDYLKGKDQTTPWPILLNICLYHNPNEKPYPYSTSVYDHFIAPDMAESLGIFTKFHLGDLNTIPDKTLATHGSINLMEKLLKYSRHRDAFNILAQELEKSKSWLLLQGNYWKTILVYSSHVIGRKGNSEKKLVNLFKDVLSKNENEIMRTIAQTIEERGEKRGIQKGIQKGIQVKAIEIAKSMLKKELAISLIQEVTGLSKQTIEKLKQE